MKKLSKKTKKCLPWQYNKPYSLISKKIKEKLTSAFWKLAMLFIKLVFLHKNLPESFKEILVSSLKSKGKHPSWKRELVSVSRFISMVYRKSLKWAAYTSNNNSSSSTLFELASNSSCFLLTSLFILFIPSCIDLLRRSPAITFKLALKLSAIMDQNPPRTPSALVNVVADPLYINFGDLRSTLDILVTKFRLESPGFSHFLVLNKYSKASASCSIVSMSVVLLSPS